MVNNLDKIKFITSFLTKVEIMREMVAGHGIKGEDVERLWKEFVDSIDCKVIESFKFGMKFVEAPKKIKLRLRTLINFQHLFIAKEVRAYLVTGDKDLIKKSNEFYDKIISYPKLRKLVNR